MAIIIDLLERLMRELLEEYKNDFIPKLSERIHREGSSPDSFPYSFLNVLRMFINYASYYFRDFIDHYLHVKELQNSSEALYKSLGTPTRMLRYYLVLLLGAYLDEHYTKKEKFCILNDIALIVLYKKKYESILNNITATLCNTFEADDFFCDNSTKQITSQIAILAREFVDFLFLGEHPVSYTTFMPVKVNGNFLIIRLFRSLNYNGFISQFEELEFRELYQIDNPNFNFTPFSGSLSGIPPFQSKVAVIVYRDHERIKDYGELFDTYTILETSINAVTKRYNQLSIQKRELEAAISYSLEIAALDKLLGSAWVISSDAQKAILNNTLASSLLHERKYSNYDELYLNLVQEAISFFEECIRW